eukprot:CAMPEP_0171914846 /NCGR_PEP_ID=MMETSP0993-20121228/13252_1 /TAXON_ID=483369 /ORGANISM="non described non described, Strain CCMP2098" /LENGTH=176 /DNA_ID=CAMNT_0012549565 /DNA_START=72 /DNA_END=602 /DNA_ORIENTATION=-
MVADYTCPTYFALWGLGFHTVVSLIFNRFTTKVPFLDGASAQNFKNVILFLNVTVGVIHHVNIGLPLELMNNIFLMCAVGNLVSQICVYRSFFFDYSLQRALVMTGTGIFGTVGIAGPIAPFFGINDFTIPTDLIAIVDGLNTNKEPGCMHHMAGETILLLVMLSWFMPSDKAHKA